VSLSPAMPPEPPYARSVLSAALYGSALCCALPCQARPYRHSGRAEQAGSAVFMGCTHVSVGWHSLERNSFSICFTLNLSLNFKNSYLSIQSSKNYETSCIDFVILFSIQEKYCCKMIAPGWLCFSLILVSRSLINKACIVIACRTCHRRAHSEGGEDGTGCS
jgi:hypothetical protein